MYNKATAPVPGTDVPAAVILLLAGEAIGSFRAKDFGINGPKFPLGIGYAITGLVADADTTAIAAGQVKVVMQYR